ncbi:acyl-CoA thioesterase [Crateriforma spongiae]|uniref:acyl-CoA thioesterase n=1 Tax=Crateriforma spongiae TaxID=2724528 RepID=UPI0028F440F4|nr:thioesterase family protein [Crateriforma spongiae]
MNKPDVFSVQRRVEFCETDAAGIVHFAAFFPWMESAEHALLRSLGISVLPRQRDDTKPLTWPRVSAQCDYLSAARFEDELTVDVSVRNIGRSSVTYRFTFRCGDRMLARGQVVSVCCELAAHGKLTKAPIPDSIREALSRYLDAPESPQDSPDQPSV